MKDPKFPKPKKKKRETVGKAKKKVWALFSIYIRTRDCLSSTGTKEEGKCCTCGKIYNFKELQAGHFIPGRRSSVLFDERNCHAQCLRCNVFLRGNMIHYYQFMNINYGPSIIAELMEKDMTIKKFTVPELQELFNTYTFKLYEFK